MAEEKSRIRKALVFKMLCSTIRIIFLMELEIWLFPKLDLVLTLKSKTKEHVNLFMLEASI